MAVLLDVTFDLVVFEAVAFPAVTLDGAVTLLLVPLVVLEGVTVVELVVLLVTVALPVVLTDELLEVLLATTAGIGIGKGAHLH